MSKTKEVKMPYSTCPYCSTAYEYDTCQDDYKGCKSITRKVGSRDLELHVCPNCDGILAITVVEDNGSSVYTADGANTLVI